MRTSPTKGKRMPNSMFGIFCTEFNKMPVGTRYTSKQIREKIPSTLKRNEMATHGMPYTVSIFNIMMMATGLAKRVKRGVFEVLGHVPDFVTYSTCWANRGHDTRIINGKTIKYQKWKLGDPPLVNEKKVKSNTDGVEGEIRIGETYIIVTKDKLAAKEILKFILEKGSKIEVEAWIIKGTNNIAANIPWSPGFKRSFGDDMTKFKGFVSFACATSNDGIQSGLDIAVTKEIARKIVVDLISERKPHQVIKAKAGSDIEVIIIDLFPHSAFASVKFPDGKVGPVPIGSLSNMCLTLAPPVIPQKEHSVEIYKEAQIVSILKEGLSAVDAAKKIMKLF